jgi:hypothetical protein
MTPLPSPEAIAHAQRFVGRGWMARQDSTSREGKWQRELARAGYLRRQLSEWHFTLAGRRALNGED